MALMKPASPSLLERLASRAVLGYIRRTPLERGKFRLMRMTRSLLVVDLEPGLFVRVAGLSRVEQEIIESGMFERETAEFFVSLLGEGMTVFDVGANIGQYALLAARHVGPAGRVHAFEPDPRAAHRLRGNLELNGFENVAVHEVAVSDRPGTARLTFLDPDDPGENTIMGRDGDAVAIDVPTITIDDYVDRHGIDAVHVMKIDIEGAEILALRGAVELLSCDAAPLIIMELNPRMLTFGGGSREELLALLARYGYTYFPIATYGAHTSDPWINGVAAKQGHLQRFPALDGLNWATV